MAEASQTFSHSEVEDISPFRDTPLSKPLPCSRSQFPLCKGVMLPQLWKFLHQLVSSLVPLPASSRVLLPLLWGAHWKALPKTATNSLAGARGGRGASLEQVVSNSDLGFFFPQIDKRTLRPLFTHCRGGTSGSRCLLSLLRF